MRLCLLFLSASEAEPLDLGSQALAWEPVKYSSAVTMGYCDQISEQSQKSLLPAFVRSGMVSFEAISLK